MHKKTNKNKYLIVLVALLLPIILVLSIPNYKIQIYKFYSQAKLYLYSKYATKVLGSPIPTNFIDANKLTEKLNNPAYWASDQIKRDFSSYDDLSRQNVLATFNAIEPQNLVVMFEIKDGKLIVSQHEHKMNGSAENGLKIYTNVFEYIAKSGKVKNVSFLLRLSDFFPEDSKTHKLKFAPILTTSKDLNRKVEQDLILIPDYMSLEDIPKLTQRILLANKQYPWKKKENKVLWRGGRADISGFRHTLVEYASKSPNGFIDAKFVENNTNYMLPEQQIKYKYLLNIDGHTAAWTRPIWQLLSNSVFIKQDSSLSQWYYQVLQPGIHYVPVTNNPALLERDIIKYSDDRLQAIANAGNKFAKENLTIDDMVAYLVMVLQKYEALQN